MRTRSQGPIVASDCYINNNGNIEETKNEGDITIQQDPLSIREGIGVDSATGIDAQALDTQHEDLEECGVSSGSEEEIPDRTTPLVEQQSQHPVASIGMDISPGRTRRRLPNPWSFSFLTLTTTLVAAVLTLAIVQAFLTRQLDSKGCAMSYMRPSFTKFADFDTEHTRFASKYSLYLYREGGVDEDTRVCWSEFW